MRDLLCDPSSIAGAIDNRVVRALSRRYALDPDFLACMATCHGGRPAIGTLRIGGRQYRVAEFLTLLDCDSRLDGDFRRHFDRTDMDERVVKSITAVMDWDGNTSRCLFSDLVPFAATETDMCLDRGYVDLFCFDYRNRSWKPPVVLWDANRAMDAFFEWDSLPFDDRFGDDDQLINVRWDSFLVPVAASFRDFIELLERNT